MASIVEGYGEMSILASLVGVTEVKKDLVIHCIVFNTEKNWKPSRYSTIINFFVSFATII